MFVSTCILTVAEILVGRGRATTPPPPTFTENCWIFGNFDRIEGQKQSFQVQMGAGDGFRKFKSFVGKFRRLCAPPPPNRKKWISVICSSVLSIQAIGVLRDCSYFWFFGKLATFLWPFMGCLQMEQCGFALPVVWFWLTGASCTKVQNRRSKIV